MIHRKLLLEDEHKVSPFFGTMSVLKEVYVRFRSSVGAGTSQRVVGQHKNVQKTFISVVTVLIPARYTANATQLDPAGRPVFNTAIPKSSFIKAPIMGSGALPSWA